MTPVRKRRLALVAMLMLGLTAATALALTAFQENLTYFYQPSRVVAGEVAPGTRFRLGGLVAQDSVERGDDGLLVRFIVADCEARVPVRYRGILPDLFREGQGIVAYGRMEADGVFVADEVLAKHDENYMSPAVAAAVKDERGVSCMPVDMQANLE